MLALPATRHRATPTPSAHGQMHCSYPSFSHVPAADHMRERKEQGGGNDERLVHHDAGALCGCEGTVMLVSCDGFVLRCCTPLPLMLLLHGQQQETQLPTSIPSRAPLLGRGEGRRDEQRTRTYRCAGANPNHSKAVVSSRRGRGKRRLRHLGMGNALACVYIASHAKLAPCVCRGCPARSS